MWLLQPTLSNCELFIAVLVSHEFSALLEERLSKKVQLSMIQNMPTTFKYSMAENEVLIPK